MTYKEFILALPLQDDATLNWMIKFVKADKSFPDTDNFEIIAKHVYLQFNHKQTLAFQKSLMFYLHITKGENSASSELLKQINKIVELQNSDPKYPY